MSPLRRSTPAAQGIDTEALGLAYQRAADIPHIYSMLVIRNRALVAEEYFNGRSRSGPEPVASVGKSILGALLGIAHRDGYLRDLDQRMIDFFPEYDTASLDPRKRDITIRQLLQMRAGYPFDSNMDYFSQLSRSRDWMRFIVLTWDLENEPGSVWNYSSASSHLLAGILTRAIGTSLQDFANQHLFGPTGIPIAYWPRDPQGYCVGHGDVELSPLQLAYFGQMALDRGRWRGRRVLPSWWIDHSFENYSDTWYGSTIWPYRDIGYGYLWWQADVDDHHVYFAWGHGGQFITVVPSLNMVVVTTAFNFVGDFTDNSWDTEGAIFRLIATDVLPAAY
jgi:CubicO group peptidase (beta-lactamase class C family)